jgi:hypothetical protein
MLHELEEQLQDSVVLTPDSPEYPASLKRWSNAAEKEAVRCFFWFVEVSFLFSSLQSLNTQRILDTTFELTF